VLKGLVPCMRHAQTASTAVLPLGLYPLAAYAQDVTPVVMVLGPAVLLSPFAASYVRVTVTRKVSGRAPKYWLSLALAWLELLLWLTCIYLALNMIFGERWYRQGLAVLVTTFAISGYLNYRMLRRAGGMSTVALTASMLAVPVSLVLLTAAAWGVLALL